MKKILFFVIAFVSTMAQGQMLDKYWVQLRDKSAPSEYTLDNPSAYLSPKALERRQRQRIPIDSLDLPICPQYIAALKGAGLRVQNQSKWLNGVAVFLPAGTSPSVLDQFDFVRSYQLLEQCDSTMPDINTSSPTISNATWKPWVQYGRNYYNYAYRQIKQLGGIELHKQGYEGQGIVIGVCDAGFPGVDTIGMCRAMYNEGRLLAMRDFVWDGDSVYTVNSHGTSVLSTMAGYLPGLYVGTAPKASYILCRTESGIVETLMEEYNWAAAAEYLDSIGADIITTSLGYFYFDYDGHNHTLSDLDGRTAPMTIAAEVAASRGMVLLNAAGNDGQSDPQHLNSPADAEHILTIGACDSNGTWAPFSSYGPTADLRVKPDVLSMGAGVDCANSQGVIHRSNGTSLATPIMAGMVACLWQCMPHLTAQQVCDSVRAWGHLAQSPSMREGYGIPDFSLALLSASNNGIAHPTTSRLQIYPNPAYAGSAIQVRSPQPISTLVITDMLGRVVNKINMDLPALTITLPQLPAGIYLIRAISSQGTQTVRLVLR